MIQRRRLTLACLAVALSIVAIGTQAQTYKVLYNFTGGQDGGNPAAGLTMDKAGNFYGTAQQGGGSSGCYYVTCGTVFKLTHKGSGWNPYPPLQLSRRH